MKHFTLLLAAAALSVSAYAVDLNPAVNLASPKNQAFITKCDGPNRLSRDAEWESWTMNYTGVDADGYLVETLSKMDVAIDGDEIKIAGWHTYLAGMYVTGTIDGNTITFDNYQFIGTDTKWHDDAYLLATNMIVQNQQITGFETVGATYTMNYDAENKVITPVGDNFAWIVNTGAGQEPHDCYKYIIRPTLKYKEPIAHGDPVVLPDNAVVEKWIFSNYYLSSSSFYKGESMVDVAIDGTDVYISGFEEQWAPGAWVKGTISGSTITVPCYQYLATAPGQDQDYDLYFMAIQLIESAQGLSIGQCPDEITLTYDAEKGTITAEELMGLCVNIDIENPNQGILDLYIECAWSKTDSDAEIIAPSNPEPIAWFPYDPDYGLGYMGWDLKAYGANGCIYNVDDLYYILYADNDVFALEPEDYYGIDKTMTEIPYDFTCLDADNYYDIEVNGSEHILYFYTEISENFGCQLLYKNGDEVLKSQICLVSLNEEGKVTAIDYYDTLPGAGIAGVAMDQEVRSMEYYNIAGQKVSNPNGLTIVKVTLNDGTVKAFKVNK